MGEISTYEQGQFCWVELATTDLEVATAYYTTLFGWTVEDRPGGDQGIYRMCRVDGKDVSGLYEMDEDQRSTSSPHWRCYLAVGDVDQVAKAAESLGAKVISAPFDVMDSGRMAIIEDPSGAIVGLWQAGTVIGSQLENDPGSLSWVELQTRDTAAAGAFYRELFGWEEETIDYGDGNLYTTFRDGDSYRAGMVAIPEDEDQGYSAWLTYIETDDVDALLAKSDDMGGTTLLPARSVQDVGRFAVIQDPQGAALGVLTSAPAPAS